MPPRTIELAEEAEAVLPSSALSLAEAAAIAADPAKRIEVTWPSPGTGQTWRIRAGGWVGTFPVSDGLVVRVSPKVSVPRLFDLLRSAGRDPGFEDLGHLAPTATVEGLFEHSVRVLVDLVHVRAARGLRKAYVSVDRTGLVPTGRIDVAASAVRFASGRATLAWEQRLLTTDIDDNRILLWTLHRAARLRFEDARLSADVAHARRVMGGGVTLKPFTAADCRSGEYGRADRDYRTMHAICALVLEGLGPAPGRGSAPFPAFGVDMWSVFEDAVTSLLRRAPALRLRVLSKPTVPLGAGLRFVPDMVLLDGHGPVAVADVKYKASLSRRDVQQVVAYATAVGVDDALLIHPTPVGGGLMQVGRVRVTTLTFDLGLPPTEAADRLASAMAQSLPARAHGAPLPPGAGQLDRDDLFRISPHAPGPREDGTAPGW